MDLAFEFFGAALLPEMQEVVSILVLMDLAFELECCTASIYSIV